ncbi:MAG: universal stress protein [Nitrospirae bacterium]|nr:universal stress protein [Nitrospirota bacterium]MCL5285559.1 universal stress protein [Nitrospirota bacterium]
MSCSFRRILFPSDLSPLSPELLRQIREIGGTDLEEIHVAFVLEAFDEIPTDFPLPDVSLEPVAREAMGRLTAIARSFEPFPGRISAGVYRGRADHTLTSLAVSGNFDLVLLLSHARNLLGRLMVGSVSTSLMHLSPIPVLILKEPSRVESLKKSALLPLTGENALQPMILTQDIRKD